MADRASGEQLSLDIEPGPEAALPAHVRPMLPVAGAAPFDDSAWFFEPWWPGASALAYLEGAAARLQTGHLADPIAAFPELARMGRSFSHDGLIVEGTLLVLDEEGRPDADLLRRRLADPSERQGDAAFVASDLLFARGRSLVSYRFEERRQMLMAEITDADDCVMSRGLRGEGTTLAQAVASMGLTEISARLLAGRYRPGQQSDAWLRLPVTEVPLAPTRPLLALLQRLPL